MPSTPASYFHLLRWQVHSELHRPLVVFTPKSMLRNKAAASATADFTERPLPRRSSPTRRSTPRGVRAWSCSAAARSTTTWSPSGPHAASPTSRSSGSSGSTRCRSKTLPAALARLPGAAEVRWVQEEPANQGAWSFMALNLPEDLDRTLVPRHRVPRRRPRPSGRTTVTSTEQRGLVEQRASPDADSMYFTDRGIEELEQRRGERGGQPRLGRRSGCASSSTSTRSSRSRSSGSPPGWPASTTRTTEPGQRLFLAAHSSE